MTRAGFLVAGFKGLNFLEKISRVRRPSFVSSYEVKGTLDNAYARIKSACKENGTTFVERRDLSKDVYAGADIIFVAGWQYLLPEIDDRFVVLHDSILPRFRGFAPTVSALIRGETTIGVTALKPTELADRGPIYEQMEIEVQYPVKVRDAYLLLSDAYSRIAESIMSKSEKGLLAAMEQDEKKATYSIWRDERDYEIDWSWPSDRISRFVDAVGWPYAGARTTFKAREVIIDDVEVSGDIPFEERGPGKIWAVADGCPEVVCGKGMIRVLSARYADGCRVEFKGLRERLGAR